MNEFSFYLRQGINHITDLAGMDHMLFVITLCAVYQIKSWKQIMILVTAFTIGHSLTLAMSAMDLIRVNQGLVETLIPVTILMTSIYNISKKNATNQKFSWNYLLALVFGLIHGMGFSNYFRSMMMGISEGNIVQPLLGFNLGVEIGQAIIVACYLAVLYFATRLLSVNHRDWKLYLSGAGGGVAITMIIEAIWL